MFVRLNSAISRLVRFCSLLSWGCLEKFELDESGAARIKSVLLIDDQISDMHGRGTLIERITIFRSWNKELGNTDRQGSSTQCEVDYK